MPQLISIFVFTISTLHALGCVLDSDVADIDWSKVKGTWYDVVDIPKNYNPLCWDIVQSNEIENGIRTTFYEREYWNQKDFLTTDIEFMHQSGGIYTESSFNGTTDDGKTEGMGVPGVTLQGFVAYAKSPTPSISMKFLDDITEALNKVGLKSPTMTLKPGCLKNGGSRYTHGQTSPK